ncbi:unnamed protein product [Mucor hiemalis]
MSNSLRHNSNRRTSTLFSGLSRTHIDVGFSPGASPPTTVIAKRKDNPLIQQRCSSSSHVLELNNYPDNSNNFYNTQTTTPVSHHRRRTSRTFTPYGRREGVKKDACDNSDEALFGPVPTLASFNYSQANSITPNSTTTITHTQTPPIEQSIFDFEEIIEKQEATILDDDMVFEELEWITNTMNNNNDSLPLSPPLSPFDSESFSFSEPLDDYVLFP